MAPLYNIGRPLDAIITKNLEHTNRRSRNVETHQHFRSAPFKRGKTVGEDRLVTVLVGLRKDRLYATIRIIGMAFANILVVYGLIESTNTRCSSAPVKDKTTFCSLLHVTCRICLANLTYNSLWFGFEKGMGGSKVKGGALNHKMFISWTESVIQQ